MTKRSSILVALFAATALNVVGCGTNSATAPVVDTVAPAPVLDVNAAVVTPTSVLVTWAPSADADVVAYRVFRSVNGTSADLAVTVGTTTWTDGSVQSGGSYIYEVAAVDQAGNEGAHVVSSQVVIRTAGVPRAGEHD
jgi:fibronectin type 3 domain-containing protein